MRILAAIILWVVSGSVAFGTTPTEYPLPDGTYPSSIAPGPDGALWFIENGANKIGRMTTAGALTEFPIPTPNSQSATRSHRIVAGPDGALWFTEDAANKIGRITTAGAFSEYAVPTANAQPLAIAVGPDGALWFVEFNANQIGRIDPSGSITEFVIPTANSKPDSIAAGADGALWFVETNARSAIGLDSTAVGRITTAGQFINPLSNQSANLIAQGPNAALWVTQTCGLATITAAGVVYKNTPSMCFGDDYPTALALGSDGGMLVGVQRNRGGSYAIVDTLLAGFIPTTAPVTDLTIGQDGAVWFTETTAGAQLSGATRDSALGRVVIKSHSFSLTVNGDDGYVATNGLLNLEGWIPCAPIAPAVQANCPLSVIDGQVITLGESTTYARFLGWSGACSGTQATCTLTMDADKSVVANYLSAPPNSSTQLYISILPQARSGIIGSKLGAFLTVINAGPADAVNCTMVDTSNESANFSYQLYDAARGMTVGSSNAIFGVPAGVAQNLVISYVMTTAVAQESVSPRVYCANASAAPNFQATNTLLLSASAQPVPDVVAVAVTPSGDGILNLPGQSGAAAFAVATANLGASGVITVRAGADSPTSGGSLRLNAAICQTNPSTGQCLAAASPTVSTTINSGDTPTFAMFVVATGQIIFSPAYNRVFMTFTDAAGVIRGTTSVAVRIQ